jgi:hypothetical protein
VYVDFLSRVQNVIARCKGVRYLPVWLRFLACATGLALLVSLLWLVPWPARHDNLVPASQPVSIQASDRPAAETARPTPQPLSIPPAASTDSGQVSQVGTEQGKTSRVDPGQEGHTPTPSEEPAEVLDTQGMQELVTRLEATRSSPEEHLDTRAMDRLLAELTDKPAAPPAPRSKVPKKRARGSPRAATDRGAPGTVSPPRADSVPLRAASEMPFPDMAR